MRFQSILGAICVAISSSALADNHASGEPEWSMGSPVEIYGCKFKDGINGYAQSQKFAASWNAWADDHDAFGAHVAQLMWAEFSDGSYPTDFTWLGYWPSYEESGKDMQTRATNGAPMYAEANKFIEQCAHSEWGAWDLFPAGEWTNVDHVTEFSDCFYKEGKGDSDLLVANIAFAKEMTSRGLTGADLGAVQLWPRAGAPSGLDNAISFKWVTGYPDLQAYANFTHAWWNEGLILAWNELYGDIVSCDASRVYHSEVIRTPQ
jgi:hypothetical protein